MIFLPPRRDYQVEGKGFLLLRKRCILADEMGLGKSSQATEATNEVLSQIPISQNQSVLILVPGAAGIAVWLEEIAKWGVGDWTNQVVVIRDKGPVRQQLWGIAKFVITTYTSYVKDFEAGWITRQHWTVVICDEIHRRVRNRNTKTFKALQKTASTYLFLITGSPASKGPQDLWTPLNLVNKWQFPSYWRFINMYCITNKTHWGIEVVGLKNKIKFDEMLGVNMIRRLKKDVAKDLPPKIRLELPVEMTAIQRELYTQMNNDMMMLIDQHMGDGTWEDEDEEAGYRMVIVTDVLAKITKLRQLLVCPKIIDPGIADYGAGLAAIVDKIQERTEGGSNAHCGILTPFVDEGRLFNYITEYLVMNKVMVESNIFRFMGGMEPEELAASLAKCKEDRGIALISIQYAQSWNLETAPLGFFLGFDWDPENNKQAEDRFHRLTTVESPLFYYLKHLNSVDERVLDVNDMKTRNTAEIMRSMNLRKIRELLVGRPMTEEELITAKFGKEDDNGNTDTGDLDDEIPF